MSAIPEKQMRVAGERFPYADIGAGPPVVFLHGAPGEWATWAPHLPPLAKHHRCIAYTQRWFGEHRWGEGPPFGVQTHADDLIAFIEALDVGPASIVAWSYAGGVAIAAALQRPQIFARILLYEPGAESYLTAADELEAWYADAQQAFGPVFEAVERGDNLEAVRRLIDASGDDGWFDRQPATCRRIHAAGAPVMPRLLSQAPPPVIGPSDLASLPVPVTVAWGERTRPIFKLPSQAAARALPRNTHFEVAGAGHLWPEQAPAEFAEFVGRWLQGRTDSASDSSVAIGR